MYATEQDVPRPANDTGIPENPDDPRTTGNGGNGADAADSLEADDPLAIIVAWESEGKLVRYATSVEALDRLCRSGLPFPWRLVIVGAPSAGKTFLLVVIMFALLKQGVAVGILCVDEEPEDILIRFGMLLGFDQQALEDRAPETLNGLRDKLDKYPLRLYGADDTIVTAAAKLDAYREQSGCKHAAFGVDSLQATPASIVADTPRAAVEANVRDFRRVVHQYHLLGIATSEANRNFYSRRDKADNSTAMAAGAESRAVEFGFKSLLGLTTPEGHPDVAEVEVAKNRRHYRGTFWLRFDRTDHTVAECADPTATPEARAQKQERERAAVQRELAEDCKVLAGIVQRNPGIGERNLRAALKAAGHKWGVPRLDAAKCALVNATTGVRLVNRGPHKRDVQWHVEPVAGGAWGSQ